MIKISTKVDEALWKEMKALARESHQSLSALLEAAIRGFLHRRRAREVQKHLETSIAENEKLGRLLSE